MKLKDAKKCIRKDAVIAISTCFYGTACEEINDDWFRNKIEDVENCNVTKMEIKQDGHDQEFVEIEIDIDQVG